MEETTKTARAASLFPTVPRSAVPCSLVLSIIGLHLNSKYYSLLLVKLFGGLTCS
ncbi:MULTISPECIES: hypothetical protein [Moorena]|uniref:hypothetical protein n=1 Tax=Moorena TaxID=1155738 RepID=UPI00142CB1B2|nr:hypothetical protein [Moorena sp. SIO4G3]NEO79645.1 hypothetical protein [Moorena sp. SIO4G3]